MSSGRPGRSGRAARAAAALAASVLLLALGGCSAMGRAAEPQPSVSAGPLAGVTTLGVLGDSMSLGVNACDHSGVCTQASWAMGTDADIDSLARRIGAANGRTPAIANGAVNGGSVATMLGTASKVIAAKPQLVVIMIGANDACRPSFDEMTSAARFQADYGTLMDQLTAGLPGAHILALSVPDLNRLWELGHGIGPVAKAWSTAPGCRSLLGNPSSTAAADVERRAAVGKLVEQYDDAIEAVCARHPSCIWDRDAVHDHAFTAAEISRVDFFHPSAEGQAAIARLAWAALAQAGG